jgi:hypothetical protein
MIKIEQINHKIILWIITSITLIFGIICFWIPPSVGPDASWGFQVMHSVENGGGFNLLISPDKADISQNNALFLTWWSPGQYSVPALFKLIFRVNDGRAIALTVMLCQLLGLIGFYQLFKKLGFSANLSAISVAFILCQRLCVAFYIDYYGGEVILFGFIGWFLYGCFSLNKLGIKLAAFIIIAGWIGLFCKSSFLWMYIAGLFCIWIRLSDKKRIITWVKNGFFIGISAMISFAGMYLSFLSKGTTPASSTGWISLMSAIKLSWYVTLFPASGPVLTAFSIDELLDGLSNYKTIVVFIILLISAVFSVFLIINIVRKIPVQDYKILVVIFYIVCFLFFLVSYLRQSQISFEGRHLRVTGLIAIPGMLYLVNNLKSFYKVLLGITYVGLLILNIYFIINGFIINQYKYTHGKSGITQNLIDKYSLECISKLDERNKNHIIVIPLFRVSCAPALEITKSRLITYAGGIYHGHADSIFIVVPAYYNQVKTNGLLLCFPGYKNFKEQQLSKNFRLYTAK